MKTINLCIISLALTINITAQNNTQLKLWYTHPAKVWVEALPVGNGRLGAMVFGDPIKEVIQLNENTVWAGSPNRNDNPDAKEAFPVIRKLIFEGKYKEAHDLVNQKVITKTSHGMAYQTVGNLKLYFRGHQNYSGYYRELDLEKAVATSSYSLNGINYTTKVFSSFPDQVIVVRISADKPGSVAFSASMDRPAKVDVAPRGKDELVMSGITGDFEKVKGGVKFEAIAKIITTGGNVSSTDTALIVTGADVATIYVSVGTSFKNYNDISGNADERATAYLQNAVKKNYEQALADHTTDFQKYFNKINLDLGVTDAVRNPTDVRLEQFAKGNDPHLVTLYFQFGRYLLISSSRPGGQPANLQGIWNYQLTPSWDSKYTVNINTEMNYWPSEITNLTDMNEPLVQMVRELSQTGKQTARDMYGAQGWVLHHNTDIWRINGPIDGATWGMWPMGGAWLSQHLFDKYDFNGDNEYLKSVYPVVKEASLFFLDVLTEEPELFSAARTSLVARGDESTGWSMGWKVNFWARLLDGNHAFKLITDQLTPSIQPGGRQRGGTYPNLFDAHPPFQIDGNFGCTSGIAEMMLQSQDGAIHLLPPIPGAWKKGNVKGLKARGGFEVDIQWENGEISTTRIKSSLGGNCRIRSYVSLKGKGLKEANGQNPNPFYKTTDPMKPLIHSEKTSSPLALRKVYEYDLSTKKGDIIEIIKQ